MKKMTTLIAVLGFALTMSSCAKDEMVTPNPQPQVIDTVQTDTTANNPTDDTLIVYKVYGSNADVKFNIGGYTDSIHSITPDGTFQGVWADTIRYRRETQLDLNLVFIVHWNIQNPGCPLPPLNYDGIVYGEIWFNGQLVSIDSISSADYQLQGECSYQIPQ